MHNPNKLPKADNRNSSYREPEVQFGVSPAMDRAVEAKLLNNLKLYIRPPLSVPAIATTTPHLPPTSKLKSTAPINNSDQDLLAIMASRLAKLEDIIKVQKLATRDKDKLVDELQHANSKHRKEIEQLKSEQTWLKRQIHEMETFLNDYGLVWVGSDDNQDQIAQAQGEDVPSDEEKVFKEGADEIHPHQFKLEIEKIKRNIADLTGEGKSEVVHTKGGMRRLKEPDPIPLTFYSNGFVLFEGPFRPYSTPSSIPFVRDLVDGYFPYELKEQYPNGVPFKLQDRSSEVYALKQPFSATDNFSGRANITSLGDTSIKNKSKEEFLKKLPASVIKNGRVLDIRQSIATSVFKNDSPQKLTPGVVIATTDVVNFLCNTDVISPCPQPINVEPKSAEQEIFSSVHKGRPTTPQAITTLKVKTHTIGTLIVKLRFDDTVATLRKYIDQYSTDSRAYELRTTFPNKVYTDVTATLRESGLVPNATLYVKII